MISSSLVRVGGGSAAIVGGVLILISAILGSLAIGGEGISEQASTGAYTFVTLLYLLAVVLVLGGLVGLYARQAEEAGLLGVVGFLVAFLGTALDVGAAWNQAFFTPAWASRGRPLGVAELRVHADVLARFAGLAYLRGGHAAGSGLPTPGSRTRDNRRAHQLHPAILHGGCACSCHSLARLRPPCGKG